MTINKFLSRLAITAVAAALVATACSPDDGGQAEPILDLGQTAAEANEPTTLPPIEAVEVEESSGVNVDPLVPAVSDAIEAASPPPGSFAEVASDYSQSQEFLFAEGRATANQLLAGDADAIYARFDEAMAAALSVEDMRPIVAELVAQAPSTGADRAIRLDPEAGFYVAELKWGEEIMTMAVSFTNAGEISSLELSPQMPTPPDPAVGYESDVAFRLPFEGVWFVVWGGDSAIENYHVIAPNQRHAYDIVVWKEGTTHTGDGSVNEDYWAYGQPVLAPAAGTVVGVVDGLPDRTPSEGGDIFNPAGNQVAIQVADGEYLFIAHLQPGSLTVAEGDVVESGQQIGLVGNSGNSDAPHIHVHLQNQPTLNHPEATGLPLAFTDYLANGLAVERGRPLGDQFVAPAASGS